MKIKNLYIKVVTKVQKPTTQEVINAVDAYIGRERLKNKDFMTDEDSFPAEFEQLEEQAKEQLTKVSTQMRKISKIPILDAFIRQNIGVVDQMGKVIILKKSEFSKLCKDCKFTEVEYLDILLDSNILFCKIMPIDRQTLALALSEKKITVEKFDELMEQVEE